MASMHNDVMIDVLEKGLKAGDLTAVVVRANDKDVRCNGCNSDCGCKIHCGCDGKCDPSIAEVATDEMTPDLIKRVLDYLQGRY